MHVTVTRTEFLEDRQGRTFADVVNDRNQPFDDVLDFFNDGDRQRRMEESEIHHDRAPLAGVVRELEVLPGLHRFLSTADPRQSQRLRQSIGVLIRLIMERRGWQKTGKKGSLGVRAKTAAGRPRHNTGGLALFFLRAERYEHPSATAFASVRKRSRELGSKSRRARARRNGKTSATRGAKNLSTGAS